MLITLFRCEMILLWRRSQEWLYPLVFFIVVMSLFPLAFTPDTLFLQKYFPSCIWIAALFSSLLSIENIFFTDLEEGYLEQWLLHTTPLSFILLIKLLAYWLTTALPLILLVPVFALLFHLSFSTALTLMLSLLLGTPILILIGSLGVSLTLFLRQQGVLLSLLILPLLIPVLIFGISIVQQAQSGLSIRGPLSFLAGLMILTVTVLPWVIAVTLRISME